MMLVLLGRAMVFWLYFIYLFIYFLFIFYFLFFLFFFTFFLSGYILKVLSVRDAY